ncbi:response regulator [Virgibacillus flavescens]|uniref:response regulator n=1 Tax=Virgibacillus flavescens TaxID=1611422 RepID=UPI003D33BBD3
MKKHILVVDDQPGIRFLLDEVFTNEGYQITTASTGKEALDEIHAGSFALILLDFKLPVVDGLEVLRRMEEENINIPAILMSGLAEEISKVGESCALVKHILAKPFNIMEVCKIVNDIIEE